MYYRQALEQKGCLDTKKEIATLLGKSLSLSYEQISFIHNTDVNISETINNIDILIRSLDIKEKDKENYNLILTGLNILKQFNV